MGGGNHITEVFSSPNTSDTSFSDLSTINTAGLGFTSGVSPPIGDGASQEKKSSSSSGSSKQKKSKEHHDGKEHSKSKGKSKEKEKGDKDKVRITNHMIQFLLEDQEEDLLFSLTVSLIDNLLSQTCFDVIGPFLEREP